MVEKKTDWELVEEYYTGKNDPMGILIGIRYPKELLITAKRFFKNEEDARDVIQDVAEKLFSYSAAERVVKFVPKKGNVFGALRMRVKNKSIDVLRKHRPDQVSLHSEVNLNDHDFISQPADENQSVILQKRKKIFDLIEKDFQSKGWELEIQFVNLMRQFGTGNLQDIADELGLSTRDARVIKQRINRNINSIRLNNNF